MSTPTAQNWMIFPLNANGGYVIVKITAGAAVNVVITISGPVLGNLGLEPDRWKLTRPRVEPNEPIVDAFGLHGGPGIPTMHFEWEDERGTRHAEAVAFP